MHSAGKILLRSVSLILPFIGGCNTDDGILNPPAAVPVVVRGEFTYALTFSGTGATIEIRDSARWVPAHALLSVTVSDFAGGSGVLEITDSSGGQIYRDSINGNREHLNQEVLSPMPYRVHLALRDFSGKVNCSLVLSPAELGGLVGRFVLRDTSGVVRTSFGRTAAIDFHYSLLNLSGRGQQWAKGDSRPHCEFTVWRADTLRADSFYGLAFLTVPESGNLVAGDSLRVIWRKAGTSQPLIPGRYVARADPQMWFSALGSPMIKEYLFDVLP